VRPTSQVDLMQAVVETVQEYTNDGGQV